MSRIRLLMEAQGGHLESDNETVTSKELWKVTECPLSVVH